MQNKKFIIISYLISISFILASFLISVHFCCYDRSFYTSQHNKLKLYGESIADYIGISDSELYDLTDFTLDYLNDPKANLDIQMNVDGRIREIFTDDEKLHMEDVRKLNLIANYISYIALFIFIISLVIYIKIKGSITMLCSSYIKTLVFTLCVFIIIGTFVLIDFNTFWTYFHKIFFAGNDLWLLDLRKDILIMIVPPEFFNHLVIRILVIFISTICLFGLYLNILRKKKVYD